MSHILVLHTPPDRAAAAAVATVLSDMTAFRTTVGPDVPPFRYGSDVVAIGIWTQASAGPGMADAMARALANANGKCFAFCFGGAELPMIIGQSVGEVLRESSDPSVDQARLRQAIMKFSAY